MKKLFTLLFIALIAFSCTESQKNAQLKNTKWVVETINGEKMTLEGTKELSIFINDKNEIKGFLGCNSTFGMVTIDGNKIDLSKLGSTMMACPNLEIENKFSSALREVKTYEIKGDQLYFNSDKPIIVFKVGKETPEAE